MDVDWHKVFSDAVITFATAAGLSFIWKIGEIFGESRVKSVATFLRRSVLYVKAVGICAIVGAVLTLGIDAQTGATVFIVLTGPALFGIAQGRQNAQSHLWEIVDRSEERARQRRAGTEGQPTATE